MGKGMERKKEGKKIGPAEDKERRVDLVLYHKGMDTVVKKQAAEGQKKKCE